MIFADLQLRLSTGVKQIIDCLVVDLYILALDFKLNLLNSFVLEHRLIVEMILFI